MSVQKDGKRAGGGWALGLIISQRTRGHIETLKSVFEDLHPGCGFSAEHLANLFKKNKLLLMSKSRTRPWSGPSMFLSTAVYLLCLKADFFTITFLIKARARSLRDHPSSLSAE